MRVAIADDDGVQSETLTLTASPASVEESSGEVEVTITATLDSAPFNTATTVSILALAADTDGAAPDGDFAFPGDTTLVIPAGHTTASTEVTLTVLDDDIDEADEATTIRGRIVATDESVAQFGLDIASDTITIEDDDTAGVTVAPPH